MDQAAMTSLASAGAVVISIASFVFAVLSWRESHRPIVTARITTEKGGNVGSPIELLVENTGNRPAINIRLSVDRAELDKALSADLNDALRKAVERCFDSETFIPVLEAGKRVTNSFGMFSQERSTWQYKSTINITIAYEDLGRRRFRNSVPIWLVDNRGFALEHFEAGTS